MIDSGFNVSFIAAQVCLLCASVGGGERQEVMRQRHAAEDTDLSNLASSPNAISETRKVKFAGNISAENNKDGHII